MDGSSKVKYRPTKTQLTMTDLKTMCDSLKAENRVLKKELRKAQEDRAWALVKLQEAQNENRQLGMMITYLSEKGEKKSGQHSRPPLD